MTAWAARFETGSALVQAVLLALLILLGVLSMLGLGPWTWGPVLVFLALVGAGRARLHGVAKTLLVVLLIVGLAAGIDDPALFAEATGRAAFLTGLIAALFLLGRVVGRAPDVRHMAELLVCQPQGRRYLAITLGAHLLSIILNFGAVALLSAFLAPQRAALERQGALVPLTLAMLRGFAAMPMWSPLALSVLITLSLIPEVPYWRILPVCLCGAALYMGAGILLDRRGTAERGGPSASAAPLTPPERRVLLRVVARTAGLVGGVALLSWATGLPMLNAVFVAILGVIGWGWLREATRDVRSGMMGDLGTVGHDGVNELVILATAAFAGPVLTHYLHGFDDALPLAGPLVAALLVAIVPAAMVACGMLAINPILSASLLIGALKPVWPEADLHLLALTVIFGWGITSAGTPFTANVLIAARNMGVSATRLAFEGNARLTAAAILMVGICGAAASLAL